MTIDYTSDSEMKHRLDVTDNYMNKNTATKSSVKFLKSLEINEKYEKMHRIHFVYIYNIL